MENGKVKIFHLPPKMSNLTIRTLSGALFVATILLLLFMGEWWAALLILLLIVIATKEFLRITNGTKFSITSAVTLLFSASIYILSHLYVANRVDKSYFLLLPPLYLAVVLSILFSKESLPNRSSGSNFKEGLLHLAAPLYIAVPLSLIPLILFDRLGNYTPLPLLSLFILLWSGDVGAYLIGTKFGQKRENRLAPSISPKKSWEGFWGGLLFVLITLLLIRTTPLFPYPLLHSIAIATLLYLLSVAGDLFESLIKRNFNVKDSGAIIPGHGGVLDRIDGALFAFPMAIGYINFFQLI